MYPNNGMPNPYQGQQAYPDGQQPYGAMPGYPGQMPGYPGQQPGYPPMPQQGYPQMGQPQMPGYPGMTPATYPGMTPATYPGMTPATYPGMTPATYPGLPSQDQMAQQFYPAQNTSYGQDMPPQQAYGQAPQQAYGQPPQQAYGPTPTQSYDSFPQQPRPTVTPSSNFDASNDAAALRKAMKGFGTDEDALIEVICRRTNGQRMEIVKAFKTCYGKDLISDITSETKDNFQKLLLACLTPKIDYYCNELQEAMSGQGTDEDVLIEVMCALPNHDIQAINHNFGRLYGLNLEDTLKADTSGAFKRLMVSLACGNRDESMKTDVNSARNDAHELKEAGVGCWGTDESAFNRILCMRNYDQLKLVCKEYENLTGHTLEKDIKKEFSGDIEDGLVALVRCANDRAEFFAKRLYNTMDGIGTDDQALIRLIVTRCEIDMVDIKEAFQRKYGKSLKSYIKGDSSGDYKHALYALIGENRS